MKIEREAELDGLIIEAEDKIEAELLARFWCNRTKVAAFERRASGMTTLTIAPSHEVKP